MMAMTDEFAPTDRLTLDLWRADGVVLFDWLMTLDFDQVPVSHKAEKQALTDLLAVLEGHMHGVTQEQIDRARSEVSKDMGWE
jgi:hypothetical protein